MLLEWDDASIPSEIYDLGCYLDRILKFKDLFEFYYFITAEFEKFYSISVLDDALYCTGSGTTTSVSYIFSNTKSFLGQSGNLGMISSSSLRETIPGVSGDGS